MGDGTLPTQMSNVTLAMQKYEAPSQKHTSATQSGWNADGDFVVLRAPSVEETDYEKPRWRNVVGLDGSI